MGIEITIILIITSLFFWSTYKNIQSRKLKGNAEFKEIRLNRISFTTTNIFVILSLIGFLILKRGEWQEDIIYRILLIVIIVHFVDLVLDVIFQLSIQKDRLMYGKNKIILLTSYKFEIPTETIQSISLNGINNKVTIKRDKIAHKISFKINQMNEKELEDLIEFIDKEKGLENIKITDNLKKIIQSFD